MTTRFFATLYIKYKSSIDHEFLSSRVHKISQVMDDDSIRKREVYKIPLAADLENVLYCIDIFKQRGTEIAFDADDMFQNFSSLVESQDYHNFTEARDAGPTDTMADFNACMSRFVLKYCTTDAKKTQHLHFTTQPEAYNKTPKSTVREHASRLITIRNYVNSMPPLAQHNITETQLRETLLRSCPSSWQTNFDVADLDIETITWEALIRYLEKQKGHADVEHNKTKSKKRDGDSNGGGNGSNRSKKKQKNRHNDNNSRGNGGGGGNRRGNRNGRGGGRNHNGGRLQNPCWQHGTHEWKNCPANRNSANYDGGNYQNQNNTGGGGGRGRGNGGPGNGGGRGGGGRGGGGRGDGNGHNQHYNDGNYYNNNGNGNQGGGNHNNGQGNDQNNGNNYYNGGGGGRGRGNGNERRVHFDNSVDQYFNEVYGPNNSGTYNHLPASEQMDTVDDAVNSVDPKEVTGGVCRMESENSSLEENGHSIRAIDEYYLALQLNNDTYFQDYPIEDDDSVLCHAHEVDFDTTVPTDTHHIDSLFYPPKADGNQDANSVFYVDPCGTCPMDIVSVSDIYTVQEQEERKKQANATIDNVEDRDPRRTASVMTIGAVQNQPGLRKMFTILFDSGSDKTMIHQRCLPKGAVPELMDSPMTSNTLAGPMQSKRRVWLNDIILPEFGKSKRVLEQDALVFDGECRYDLIVGVDFLTRSGIVMDFGEQMMTWYGIKVPMKPKGYFEDPTNKYMSLYPETDDDDEEDPADSFVTELLAAKYEKVSPLDVCRQQKHLTKEQQDQLFQVLKKYDKLFSGELGEYPHKKIKLEVMENAKPIHARPYSIPRINARTFKEELDHLCEIGVLARAGASEWASPTMGVPKKDGRIRIVSDFRQLNKVIKRKIFPLPNINEMLRSRAGYSFLTKLDISMQYYTFVLDEDSQDLTTIITPFGKYKYLRLPMGVKVATDVAQEIMTELLRELEQALVFIDDISIFDDSFKVHLESIDKVLTIMQDNNFTINPLKCEWCVQETDYLGYWLTPQGLKPWKKKVDAILKMAKPKTVTELRSFLGAVTYYRDMYPHRSHILAPLTAMTGHNRKKTQLLDWTPECDLAFKQMKALLAEEAMLAYPDHNKPFDIYTDASDYQLGAVIMQEGKPVAYYSRKLNAAQMNYTVMEKELLSIVETLKAYRSMLYGCRELNIYTDHKNLTFHNLNSRRVLRWRLLLEDFAPTFHYIQGAHNAIADSLSRLGIIPFASMGAETGKDPRPSSPTSVDSHFFSMEIDDPDLLDCFLYHPDVMEASGDSSFDAYANMRYPLQYPELREAQLADNGLMAKAENEPQRYQWKAFGDVEVLCLCLPDTDFRICVPDELLPNVIEYFHHRMGHVGERRMVETLATHLCHPNLRTRIEEYVATCRDCQQYKLPGQGYGHLPPRESLLQPWEEVATDSIGPWTVHLSNQPLQFRALTTIDTVTNLCEITRVADAGSVTAGNAFENSWLYRYPRPDRCVHDNGPEFAFGFQRKLRAWGIKGVPITAHNPQANSICERLHQTIGNIIRTYVHTQPPQTPEQAATLVDRAIGVAQHAMRITIHRTLRVSPGALSFHRDMMLNIPLVADLITIRDRRQKIIDDNLRRQNSRRRFYDYQVGDYVSIIVKDPAKLDPRTEGRYRIVQVHVNGNVTIQRSPNVTERINIRRLRPCT